MSDVSLIDADGTVRFQGTMTGGGGSQPDTLARGTFSVFGLGSSIANGAQTPLGWDDNGDPGGPVFDLSDPTVPLVITAGIYTISATVVPDDMSVDGFFQLELHMGDVTVQNDSRLATAAQPTPACAISNTYFIAENGAVQLRCRNRDGSSSQVFGIDSANVQRVA